MDVPRTFRELTASAPGLYARWSERAWGLACEGPALRLWEGLATSRGGPAGFDDYLLLLREAIGLRYLSASRPDDLALAADGGRTFLGAALCRALPRLLPSVRPRERAPLLAAVWNAGEKLMARPAWLNRYLALRLEELEALEELPRFLTRVLVEGLEGGRESRWTGPFSVSTADPTPLDGDFLPGRLHLAAPAVVCAHDRQRLDVQLALYLRPRGSGGTVWLGASPCLGLDDRSFAPPGPALRKALEAAEQPEELSRVVSPAGFVLFATPLSQRLLCVESVQ